jgi:hypothetical protein
MASAGRAHCRSAASKVATTTRLFDRLRFGPHAKEIMGDIPHYTDLTPVIQISEVIVG